MIRKQVYLGASQQQKLRRLSARLGCTEAEVVRMAIDRLPTAETAVEQRLAAAGILAPVPDEPDLPTGSGGEAWERGEMAWLAERKQPLGLSAAVLEDRR